MLYSNCVVCGKNICSSNKADEPANRLRFCSNKCHGKYKHILNRKLIHCSVCNNLISLALKYIQKSKTKRFFCSNQCKSKWHSSYNNPRKKPAVIKICQNCNKNFETSVCIEKRSSPKFCCFECFKQSPLSKRKKLPDSQKNKVNKVCLNCSNNFVVWNYRKNAKFCSVQCRQDYYREEIKCPTCSNVFKIARYRNKKYCSEHCAIKGVDKRKSKFSIEVGLFLKTCVNENFDSEVLIKTKDAKFTVDFCHKNIIIECCGDYWHCNPKIYSANYFHQNIKKPAQEIWDHEKKRKEKLEKLGYNLYFIWEKDWKENQDKIKKEVLNFYEIHKDKQN